MSTRPTTIDIVKQTLIEGYIERRRSMTVDELAAKSGFTAATIRKMQKAGDMSFADWWNTQVSVGGKVRKRLVFEPTKVALAVYIKESRNA